VEDKKIICGRNPVLEYLKSIAPGSDTELFISEKAHGKIINAIRTEARSKNITPQYMDRGFFSRIGPSSQHQGVVLKTTLAIARGDAADLLERAKKRQGVLVFLDQLNDPHNIGSIIRTAEAFGCGGIILTRTGSPGMTPAVIKASSGATAHIDIVTIQNAASFLEGARSLGFWIIGATEKGVAPTTDILSLRPAVIVIGSEGSGMRRLTMDKCDHLVGVPLPGRVSSLNASVAAGILIYEIMKTKSSG
jgi:23S rRNA (guanosine2251-2'-O)-methyltransferase